MDKYYAIVYQAPTLELVILAVALITLGVAAIAQIRVKSRKPLDITKWRMTEEALLQSEERLRHSQGQLQAIFQNAACGIGVIDRQGRYIKVNNRLAEMLGYSAHELLSRLPTNFTHPDDLQLTTDNLNQLLTGEIPYRLEKRFVRKDGEMFWAEVVANPVRARDGNIEAYVGIITDITERKAAEQALRTSEERYRTLYNTTPVMLHSIDRNGCLISVSDFWLKIMGYERHEVLGRMSSEFLTQNSRKYAQEVVLPEFFRTGFCKDIAYQFVKKNGEVVDTLLSATAERDSTGQITRSLAVILDISERKHAEAERARLEAQLRESQKMEAIGQLAGGIAHDFNNVLSIILGNIALLQHTVRSASPYETGILNELSEIEHAAQRAATLTRQLLTFSRRQAAHTVMIDLNELLNGMQKMLRGLITENVTLELRLTENLPKVEADPAQLEQVLINLSVNARDAMPRGGTLTITTRSIGLDRPYIGQHNEVPPGHYVMLSITDTGCGMSQDTLQHLFEPFFTTKPVGQGTGLGLAMVYGIITQFSGQIAVHSTLQHGSTFEIYLPAAALNSPSEERSSYTPSQLGGHETVLLCEDDEGVRQLAVEILHRAGYRVMSAPDARVALTLADRFLGLIDLLVTDVIMPNMNGKQLADALQAKRPKLKTLYVSGYASSIIACQGVIQQNVNFLEKPFNQDKLLEKVRLALDT